MITKEWFIDNNPILGYKWSVQAEFGIVSITEETLFNREEFQHFFSYDAKVDYAIELGWRFNIDNGESYRIKGH